MSTFALHRRREPQAKNPCIATAAQRYRPRAFAFRRHPEPQAKDPRLPAAEHRHSSATIFFCVFAFVMVSFSIAAPCHAQGCSQCLDNTRATPPAVQAAYRHAIYLLGGVGVGLFIAGTLFLRRER